MMGSGQPELKSLSHARLDPVTRVLESYIEASVEQCLKGPNTSQQNGLLFLSAWHEAMPALVHLDPVLDPVDSRVFAVLWIWARQQGRGSTAFPAYDYLMERCHIRSRATLARSLAILRICRWITLCRRVRDERGRHRGNIYAIHEEPLQLASTVYLDPSYMDFLHEATQHHRGRVRKVAHAMLESLERRVEEGEDVLADSPLSQTGQRLEALGTAVNRGPGNYFTFHHRSIAALQAWRRHRENTRFGQVQKLNSDRVQNLNSVLCSSSYLKKATTTRRDREDSLSVAEKTPAAELVFPETLSANERRLAQMYLKGLEATLQQGLLDELGEKLRRQAKTDRPVRNPIGLLAWMCQEARAGRPPLTSDHLHCRERRERERRINERIEAEQQRLTAMALQQAGSGLAPWRTAPCHQRAQGTNERGDQSR